MLRYVLILRKSDPYILEGESNAKKCFYIYLRVLSTSWKIATLYLANYMSSYVQKPKLTFAINTSNCLGSALLSLEVSLAGSSIKYSLDL